MHDEAGGTVTLFAVNRHGTETIDVDVSLQGFSGGKVIDHQVMTHSDLEAVNTAKTPNAVVPKKGTGASVAEGKLTLKVPPYSYQMIRVKL